MSSVAYIPQLKLAEMPDIFIRENFKLLDDYFKTQNQLMNFKFFEVNFDAATTKKALAHGFSSAPLDVILTHISGAGKVSFLFGLFDATNIYLDATDACKVRFFLGTQFQTPGQGGLATTAKETVG